MRKRVPPSEQLKQALTTLLAQGSESAEHPLDQFIRLGARYLLQVAYEREVTEWLGRAHYQLGNLLDRTFGEGRRRTKVILRFPTETACLKLVFATLLTAAQRWRGMRMPPRIRRELDAICQERYPVQSQVA